MTVQVPWWNTRIGDAEANAARDAILSKKLSQGSITAELESKLSAALGVPFVTMTTSGSTALVTALVAAGIRPGDEVLVPNRTFIATAHAVQLIGATVRLVDTCPDRPVIDVEQIKRKITPKTRAIIPVHVNGSACDVDHLMDICRRHSLLLIEDTAQALFSKHRGKFLGTFGLFGCFSLGVTKIMTSGQGGFVVTSDQAAHERAQLMRFHGVPSPRGGTFDQFGFNFRYTDFQAAVALRQLEKIGTKIGAHRDLYRKYRDVIASLGRLKLQHTDIEAGELPLWIQVMCPEREELVAFLTDRGIGTMATTPNLSDSPHLQESGPFPNSNRFAAHEVILPSGPDQEPADIDRTLEALKAFDMTQHRKAG